MQYDHKDPYINDDHIEGEEIFSKIPYTTLAPAKASLHLIIAQGEGAKAVLELAKKTEREFWDKTHLVYIPDGDEKNYSATLQDLHPRWYYEWPTTGSATSRIQGLLSEFKRGVKLYVSGTSDFIGLMYKYAADVGLNTYEACAERRGPKTRRIQCVHCKGFMDDVTTQPVTCTHCGLALFVRGHYSRRLAAYQGVCINAEDMSEIPEIEELFK